MHMSKYMHVILTHTFYAYTFFFLLQKFKIIVACKHKLEKLKRLKMLNFKHFLNNNKEYMLIIENT